MILKKLMAVACAATMCVVLAGCGSAATSASASSASAGGAASASAEASPASAAARAESAQSVSSDASAPVAAANSQSQVNASSEAAPLTIADGVYEVAVTTDSSMFHLNETKKGKGELTVKDGQAVVHMTLVSKKIVNLYAGTAEQAEADEAGWIQPTTDEVTYDDGMTEEVYGFDVPVPVLDEPFDVSILGEKGTWYRHEVTVANPVE